MAQASLIAVAQSWPDYARQTEIRWDRMGSAAGGSARNLCKSALRLLFLVPDW